MTRGCRRRSSHVADGCAPSRGANRVQVGVALSKGLLLLEREQWDLSFGVMLDFDLARYESIPACDMIYFKRPTVSID
ncbi:hypothetical protein NL676_002831 [Syzygium grande]|nr:hypothetical protein NL676_002831 [Syzygium grande]